MRDVSFRHPRAPALTIDRVSLALQAGEVLGLVGPNAAGKSTLARLLCGLLTPQSGEAILEGAPIASIPLRERARRVAFLSQAQPSELPFTAREVALMGRAPHLGLWALEAPNDHAIADAALREMDSADLADRTLSQLSGGERQRVFLARAFAQEARALVLDEPTVALDLAHQVLLAQAVRKRAAAGGAALLVLHDLGLAASACDRLALVVQGRIEAVGTPKDVLEPESLARVYGTAVDVVVDPATGVPLVAARISR
ncbi:MAG: ABC transporter ATP-binding protein [Deltaproteobacteria bacterium]|nr:ABC transporter ATP-binding protein [Deltaproteobacteria bacterium]